MKMEILFIKDKYKIYNNAKTEKKNVFIHYGLKLIYNEIRYDILSFYLENVNDRIKIKVPRP